MSTEKRNISKNNSSEIKEIKVYGIDFNITKTVLLGKWSPFNFLENYKNPCWKERLPKEYAIEYQNEQETTDGKLQVEQLQQVFEARLRKSAHPWRVRCLPYLFIAGVTKSGTTDMYDALSLHPDIHQPFLKEPLYWNRERMPGHVHFNFVDGTSTMFWADNGWESHPNNAGLQEPIHLTADDLHTLLPNAKILLMMRNPVSRALSAFKMYNKELRIKHRHGCKMTPEGFHKGVAEGVQLYERCFKTHGVRACAYNVTLSCLLHPISLRPGFYSVYLQDWWRVYDRDQILIIRSEDYNKDRLKYVREVWDFLGLREVSSSINDHIAMKNVSFSGRVSLAMLPETKQLLTRFYARFNKGLEKMLGRKMWSDDD